MRASLQRKHQHPSKLSFNLTSMTSSPHPACESAKERKVPEPSPCSPGGAPARLAILRVADALASAQAAGFFAESPVPNASFMHSLLQARMITVVKANTERCNRVENVPKGVGELRTTMRKVPRAACQTFHNR